MNKKIKRIVASAISAWGVFFQFPGVVYSGSLDEIIGSFSGSEVDDTSDDREIEKTLGVIGREPYFSKMPAKTLAERVEKNSKSETEIDKECEFYTNLKKFIDEKHYNPCPLEGKYFRDYRFSSIIENLKTYIVYPVESEKCYRPIVFPKFRNSIDLKKLHFTKCSFSYCRLKNFLDLNLGKVYLLPLEVKDDLTQMPLEISNSEEYFFRGGFKIVIIGEGRNEGKIVRFDFDSIEDEDIYEYFVKGITTDYVKRYNKVIKKIGSIENLNNPYRMSTKIIENKEDVNRVILEKLVLESKEKEYKNVIPAEKYKEDFSLKEIAVPNGIDAINEAAFQNCKFLKKIVLPDGLEKIDKAAFLGCESLASINIPESVNLLSPEVFKGCTSLKDVIVPSGVKKIKDSTFQGCESLEHVVLKPGLEKIDKAAFLGCESLASINIPQSVNSLCSNAFYGCTSLDNVAIPPGVNKIESSLFDNCKSLKHISLPFELIAIEERAFAGCEGLQFISIPESVSRLDSCAFMDCTSLKNIVIPCRIKTINVATFKNCKSLKKINLPEKLEKIDMCAFSGCESLESINIPNTVSYLGECAFEGCTSLANVIVPRKVESIKSCAFRNCKNLKNIVLQGKIKEIEEFAFEGCENLEYISIPESVNCIKSDVFRGCSKLRYIEYAGRLYKSVEEFLEYFYRENYPAYF